jgi:hypothetical protein
VCHICNFLPDETPASQRQQTAVVFSLYDECLNAIDELLLPHYFVSAIEECVQHTHYFVRVKALTLLNERVNHYREQGVRAQEELGYFLDTGTLLHARLAATLSGDVRAGIDTELFLLNLDTLVSALSNANVGSEASDKVYVAMIPTYMGFSQFSVRPGVNSSQRVTQDTEVGQCRVVWSGVVMCGV